MRRMVLVMLLLFCLLASCMGPGTPTAAPVLSLTATRSIDTPSGTPTARFTWTPTYTTAVPSSTPTIDTIFLSTFDPKTAVTKTRSSPQKCPKVNPLLKPDFPLYRYLKQGIELVHYSEYWPKAVEYLNAGGKSSLLRDYLVGTDPNYGAEVDLTGDGVPELFISSRAANVLMCVDGRYEDVLTIATADPYPSPRILTIQDMNLDGLPELVMQGSVMSAGLLIYYIYEWNGAEFQSLIWSGERLAPWFQTRTGKAMNWYGNSISGEELDGLSTIATIEDMDGNGTMELVLHNNIAIPKYRYYGPWRKTTEVYQWNGFYFGLSQVDIEPPVYRFQAVEDGDRLSLLGEYEQALKFYQRAIYSQTLAGWSLDHYQEQFSTENKGEITPTPFPSDFEEYMNLAAYAQYRIMLLQVVQNQTEAVHVSFSNLGKTYPQGQPGSLYAELATTFWENYSSTHSIGEGCAAAIRFTDEHQEEIFTYLGNKHDYAVTHGYWSHYYTSWDLCPFE